VRAARRASPRRRGCSADAQFRSTLPQPVPSGTGRHMSARYPTVKLIGLAGFASMLSDPLAALEPGPTIPYEKYQLPNGLEVILSQDRTLPLVTVDIGCRAGAANEEPTRTVFAHLFEHMMFTGSKHVPRGL